MIIHDLQTIIVATKYLNTFNEMTYTQTKSVNKTEAKIGGIEGGKKNKLSFDVNVQKRAQKHR